MDHTVLTRKELYELVWKESLLSLSKRFLISDVGLRKICIRMDIPVPPVGHWTKVQFGKKVHQVALPLHYEGDETVKLPLRDASSTVAMRNTPSPQAMKALEVEGDQSLVFQVPEQLVKPDPLVVLSKSILSKQKPDNYSYKGTVSSGYEALDIRVAKTNVERALLLFDTLIKAIRARGHSVAIKNRKTIALVGGHDFELMLREKMRKESVNDGSWTRQVYYPKGILALQVGGWGGREYKDGKTRLEEQLAKIIGGLELSSTDLTERHRALEKTMAARRERERQEKELEERRGEELLRFKKLLAHSERWHKAENLRRYIQELEGRAAANPPVAPEILEWLAWAKRKADWYDPFLESPDELLPDVDQNTLELPPKAHGYSWGY